MSNLEATGILGALFLLPGFLSYKICMQLRVEKKIDNWEKVMNVLIFAIINYSIAYFIFKLIYHQKISILKDAQGIINTILVTRSSNVFIAVTVISGLSFILAFIAAKMYRNNAINKIARCLNITDVENNDPVFVDIMNDDDMINKQKWCIPLEDLLINGEIAKYDCDGDSIEILLKNVIITDKKTNQTTNHQHFYLSAKMNGFKMYK